MGQDLAGDTPVEITKNVTIRPHELIIPGDLIEKVGLMHATKGDVSEPGMVLVVR